MLQGEGRGESGTGKELAAPRALGSRRDEPFVAVNCAASRVHADREGLFGHERARSPTRGSRVGGFEAGGTLFLDEIGELSPGVQAKLLRALEERRIDRLGGAQPSRST